jgi:hypothetical protein
LLSHRVPVDPNHLVYAGGVAAAHDVGNIVQGHHPRGQPAAAQVQVAFLVLYIAVQAQVAFLALYTALLVQVAFLMLYIHAMGSILLQKVLHKYTCIAGYIIVKAF